MNCGVIKGHGEYVGVTIYIRHHGDQFNLFNIINGSHSWNPI